MFGQTGEADLVMPSERVDEIFLTNYLLGKLSEDEEVRVEDRAFADASYLGELEAAEADLIDAYVRGDLTHNDRRGFDRRFLTSPGRRSKVEFAIALAKAITEMKATESGAGRKSFRQAMAAAFAHWGQSLQFAAGGALVILSLGGWWLARENAAIRSRVSSLEVRNRELESRWNQAGREPANRPESARTQSSAPPSLPAIASLVLVPGLPRAATREKRLELPPGAQINHIEIQVEARDDYPRFRAEIRSPQRDRGGGHRQS